MNKRRNRFSNEQDSLSEGSNPKQKFSLLETFRLHSCEIANQYRRNLHEEKKFLNNKGFSPKHRHSESSQEPRSQIRRGTIKIGNIGNTLAKSAARDKRRSSKMSQISGLESVKGSIGGNFDQLNEKRDQKRQSHSKQAIKLKEYPITITSQSSLNQLGQSNSKPSITDGVKVIPLSQSQSKQSINDSGKIQFQVEMTDMKRLKMTPNMKNQQILADAVFSPQSSDFKSESKQVKNMGKKSISQKELELMDNLSGINEELAQKDSEQDHISDFFHQSQPFSDPKILDVNYAKQKSQQKPEISDIFTQNKQQDEEEELNMEDIFANQGDDDNIKLSGSFNVDVNDVEQLKLVYGYKPKTKTTKITEHSDEDKESLGIPSPVPSPNAVKNTQKKKDSQKPQNQNKEQKSPTPKREPKQSTTPTRDLKQLTAKELISQLHEKIPLSGDYYDEHLTDILQISLQQMWDEFLEHDCKSSYLEFWAQEMEAKNTQETKWGQEEIFITQTSKKEKKDQKPELVAGEKASLMRVLTGTLPVKGWPMQNSQTLKCHQAVVHKNAHYIRIKVTTRASGIMSSDTCQLEEYWDIYAETQESLQVAVRHSFRVIQHSQPYFVADKLKQHMTQYAVTSFKKWLEWARQRTIANKDTKEIIDQMPNLEQKENQRAQMQQDVNRYSFAPSQVFQHEKKEQSPIQPRIKVDLKSEVEKNKSAEEKMLKPQAKVEINKKVQYFDQIELKTEYLEEKQQKVQQKKVKINETIIDQSASKFSVPLSQPPQIKNVVKKADITDLKQEVEKQTALKQNKKQEVLPRSPENKKVQPVSPDEKKKKKSKSRKSKVEDFSPTPIQPSVDQIELQHLRDYLQNERVRNKALESQLKEQKLGTHHLKQTVENLQTQMVQRDKSQIVQSLQILLQDKENHLQHTNEQLITLKHEYKQLKDKYDNLNLLTKEKQAERAIFESELGVENQKIKQIVVTQEKQLENMTKIKNKYKVGKEIIAYYEALTEDLVAENAKLVLDLSKLRLIEYQKNEVYERNKKLEEDNQKLLEVEKGLLHKVEMEQILRDQFKSFVKQNIDIFDFEQFKLENSMLNQTVTDITSMSPLSTTITKTPNKRNQSPNFFNYNTLPDQDFQHTEQIFQTPTQPRLMTQQKLTPSQAGKGRVSAAKSQASTPHVLDLSRIKKRTPIL